MQSITAFLCLTLSLFTYGANNELPSLGDSTSGLISIEQEHKLGRAWLRNLRQQASTIHDPVLTEYVESLIYRLASNSQVKDRRFEILLLDNKQLNAFAVPGGIIGINAGLFIHAQTEAEFAAVLAHELAHLSQRHFARQIEESRKQAPIAIATLLGSIMLLATNNTEAGFAGLMTSQAAATQSALSYSRDWEREADRLGFHTIAASEIDPKGMPDMFRRMYDAHKYSQRPPEFLTTHPVTESRISDAAARVANHSGNIRDEDIEYQLMRTRILVDYKEDSHNLAHYQKRLRNSKHKADKFIAQYALALLHMKQKKYKQALVQSNALLAQDGHRISYQVLHAQSLYGLGKKQQAMDYLKSQIRLNPDNHPLTMNFIEMLNMETRHHEAITQLRRHSLIRPNDPSIWIKLSELEGKTKNNVAMHQSRAEFLYLTGQNDKALKQLKTALELSEGNYLMSARIEQRAREISSSNEGLDF